MTAEVIVLNREAVAIAADSAVTLREPDPKIYNTANKLFQLSAMEPIAIMVYGSGAFGPIPWETAVKEHRRRLGTRTFGTVDEYASNFVEGLSSLVPHYSQQEQLGLVQRVARSELANARLRVETTANELEIDGDLLDEDDKNHIILEWMKRRVKLLQSLPCTDSISASLAGQHLSMAIPNWSSYLEAQLPGFTIDSSISSRARALVRNALRSIDSNPWSSGVVIVGFGDDELFPAFSHYVVDGVVANSVRSRHLDSAQIGEGSSACIRAFAQGDMVQTFMDGLHPMYPEALRSLVKRTLDLMVDRIDDNLSVLPSSTKRDECLGDLKDVVSTIVDDFEQNLQRLLEENHSGPIMSIVGLLPKEELAEMAETLVSLTSFKRRMTPEAETVGGPIDVAVISKGDGLVWVKRKHYFDKELNVRYFERNVRRYTTSDIKEDKNDR